MDITINVEDYKLNVRAAGVIIHNGKILAHKNINSDHYAFSKYNKKGNKRRIRKRC